MGNIVEELKASNVGHAHRYEFIPKQITKETIKIVHYFAMDTVKRIINKIDVLDIKDTHTLKNSIAATVHTNASGNQSLVRFFYEWYGVCVEQGVGRYFGIDADLPHGTGLKSENVKAPRISGIGYGAMETTIVGVPDKWYTKRGKPIFRGEYHKARPFLSSEIRRSVDAVSMRLMRDAGQLLSIHTMKSVANLLHDTQIAAMAPYLEKGTLVAEYSDEKGMDLKIEV